MDFEHAHNAFVGAYDIGGWILRGGKVLGLFISIATCSHSEPHKSCTNHLQRLEVPFVRALITYWVKNQTFMSNLTG